MKDAAVHDLRDRDPRDHDLDPFDRVHLGWGDRLEVDLLGTGHRAADPLVKKALGRDHDLARGSSTMRSRRLPRRTAIRSTECSSSHSSTQDSFQPHPPQCDAHSRRSLETRHETAMNASGHEPRFQSARADGRRSGTESDRRISVTTLRHGPSERHEFDQRIRSCRRPTAVRRGPSREEKWVFASFHRVGNAPRAEWRNKLQNRSPRGALSTR